MPSAKGEYFLVHDLGTSSDKAVLYDSEGKFIGSIVHKYPTYYPVTQWAEQSVDDWWQAVCMTTKELLQVTKVPSSNILAVGFSGQLQGIIPIDKEGNSLLERAIIWQDMRAVNEAHFVQEKLGWNEFYRKTGKGQAIEMFPLVKIMWVRNNLPEIYAKTFKFLQCKDYLIFKLTGSLATDYTEASMTGYLDIHKRKWDYEILDLFNIDLEKLPPLHESHEVVGEITDKAAAVTGLKAGIPVIAGAGDVAAAALGAGVIREGTAYISSGTAWWSGILTNTPMLDSEQRISTLCAMIPKKYTPHNFVQSGSACIEWFVNTFMAFEKELAEKMGISIYDIIQRKADSSTIGSKGLVFLPYLTGGGAPHQKEWIKGALLGITLAHDSSDIIRAIMEGVAFTIRNVVEIFEEKSSEINMIKMIGGGCMNVVWRQIVADVLGKELQIPEHPVESASLAIAIASGVGCGMYKDYNALEKLLKVSTIVKPNAYNHKSYLKIYQLQKNLWRRLDDFYKELSTTIQSLDIDH